MDSLSRVATVWVLRKDPLLGEVMSTTTSYEPYSDDVEKPRPDEDAVIASIVASMARTNAEAAERYYRGVRDAHAKGHAALRGEMTVLPDLPRACVR